MTANYEKQAFQENQERIGPGALMTGVDGIMRQILISAVF